MPFLTEDDAPKGRLLSFRLWLARRLVRNTGNLVVRETPVTLLPIRVERVRHLIQHSGHLARVYHVRKNLDTAATELARVTEALCS